MDLVATPVEWWRSCQDAQDGDPSARRTISYHIIHACDVNPFMHVMLIFLCILFCLDRDGSIIRWSLIVNIKIIMCFSLVCTVNKVRRFKAPRDDWVWQTLRSHTTRVDEPSMYRHGLATHANTTVLLGEPSMYIHGLGTHNRKVKHESYGWYDEHVDVCICSCTNFTWWSVIGVVNLVCVITETTRGVLFLSGSSCSNFLLTWTNLS